MKGILMTSDNAKLVRQGIKTVTRRQESSLKEINKKPDNWQLFPQSDGTFSFVNLWLKDPSGIGKVIIKPRYSVGETVYVKEKALYWDGGAGGCSQVVYQDDPEISGLLADNDLLKDTRERINKHAPIIGKWKWRSPLFMPEWAARTFTQKLNVRVERLQEITPEDCIKEGVDNLIIDGCYSGQPRVYRYFDLWDSLHGKDAHKLNPWIVRYEFKLTERHDGE